MHQTDRVSDGLVIIGGGFAGFWAAAAARRVDRDLTISLVAPEPHLVIRPRLYEAHPETLAVDLLRLLDTLDVGFVAGAANGLDIDHGTVILASRDGFDFGRLVVATGSVMRRPPVPGADEAFSVDTLTDAVRFDEQLAAIAAEIDEPAIAVVGGGFTGIELALELRDRLAAHGRDEAGERARIVLIDRAEVVGSELGGGPRPTIETALQDARIEMLLGVSIAEMGQGHVAFDDGARLDVDAVVLATGLEAAPFAAQVPGERDRAGRLLTDQFLRAPEAPRIFVTGDAASADTGDGHRTLASCQHALQLGRVAGENAARDLRGEPLVAYEQLRYVTCLDLGRSGAVFTQGWDREVTLTGREAKDLKVTINTEVIYPPADATADELMALSDLDPAARPSVAPRGE